MREEYGIKKDLLKTLASAQVQIGVTMQIIKDGNKVEQANQQLCSVIGHLKKASETQFIHLLRNEIEKRTNEMSEHANLNDEQDKVLEGIFKQIDFYKYDAYINVFDVLNKILVVLNKK